jgi:hypothetical protein
MEEINDHLRDLCEQLICYFIAHGLKFEDKINQDLKWCIGSYNFDHNIVGLIDYGEASYIILDSLLLKSNDKIGIELKLDLRKTLDFYTIHQHM